MTSIDLSRSIAFRTVLGATTIACSQGPSRLDSTSTLSSKLATSTAPTQNPVLPAQAIGSTLQPLPGDPTLYSQTELVKAGYMMRPDPKKAPSGYAKWRELYSKPVHLVGPANLPPLSPPTFLGNFESDTQAGLDMNETNGFIGFGEAFGWWIVPTVESNPALLNEAALWIGIGGPSPQCGIIMKDDQNFQPPTYQAVYENPASDPPNTGATPVMDVSPGDSFVCSLYPGDADQTFDISGTLIWYSFCDTPSGGSANCTGWFAGRFPNDPSKGSFNLVEFIMERPTRCQEGVCTHTPLANFGTAQIWPWGGMYWNGTWSDGQYGESFDLTQMVNYPTTNDPLCGFDMGGGNTPLNYAWQNYQ